MKELHARPRVAELLVFAETAQHGREPVVRDVARTRRVSRWTGSALTGAEALGYRGAMSSPESAVAAPYGKGAGRVVPLLLACGVLFTGPFLALAAGGHGGLAHAAWRRFVQGGNGQYLILLLILGLFPVIAVLGIVSPRTGRLPLAGLLAVALAPFGVAQLAAVSALAMTVRAVSGLSIDPSQIGRIVAEGVSELSGLLIFGGTASACAAWAVAVAVAMASGRRGGARWIRAGIGVGAAIVAAGARVVFRVPFGALDVVVLVGLVAAGLLAALSTPSGEALSGEESTRAWRSLALVACAATTGVVLMDRAAHAVAVATVVDLVMPDHLDALQRGAILAAGAADLQKAPMVALVDALGAFLCFLPGLLAVPPGAWKPTRSGAVVAVAGVLVATAATLLGVRTAAGFDAAGARFKALDVPDLTLPVAPVASDGPPPDAAHVLVVRRDGRVDASAVGSFRTYGSPGIAVLADATVPFDAWMTATTAAFAPYDCQSGCWGAFVTAPEKRPDRAAAGPFAGLIGTELVAFYAELRIPRAPPPPPPSSGPPPTAKQGALRQAAEAGMAGLLGGLGGPVIAVIDDGADARLLAVTSGATFGRLPGAEVVRAPLGLDPTAQAERLRVLAALHRQYPKAVRFLLAPGPTADVGRVVALLAALGVLRVPTTHSSEPPNVTHPLDVTLTRERDGLLAAAAAPLP